MLASGRYATILLLCGLPGSGKSTIVRELETATFDYEKVLVIDYDKIADEIDTARNKAKPSSTDQSSISSQSIFDQDNLEAWRKSRVIALNKLQDTLYFHFSDEIGDCKSLLVIMDDNFHLKSMRREIYKICQDIVGDLTVPIIGFVTLYVSTPLEVCLKQNTLREGKHRVPDAVIHRMATVLEPPDPFKSYGKFENFHVTINANKNEDRASILRRIGKCMNEAVRSPIIANEQISVEELAQFEAEKILQREETFKCQLQRVDQLLRKLVGAVGKTDKSKSTMANKTRKAILDRCKADGLKTHNDESVVNEFISALVPNDVKVDSDISDSLLVRSIRIALDEFVTSRKN